ncbi:hypothetical protein, partial [Paraburkholderia sp. J67]|uniref:hypothetical protein n=1 Tax=Paraburkholderia sp. J67 TaxID=2805435 RepID=UPI002ABD60A6
MLLDADSDGQRLPRNSRQKASKDCNRAKPPESSRAGAEKLPLEEGDSRKEASRKNHEKSIKAHERRAEASLSTRRFPRETGLFGWLVSAAPALVRSRYAGFGRHRTGGNMKE